MPIQTPSDRAEKKVFHVQVATFDLCSALMAIDQGGFFSVQCTVARGIRL